MTTTEARDIVDEMIEGGWYCSMDLYTRCVRALDSYSWGVEVVRPGDTFSVGIEDDRPVLAYDGLEIDIAFGEPEGSVGTAAP